MSSNLTIEPAYRKKKTLSTELKFALRKHLGEPINYIVTPGDLEYFRGLRDAGIKDAQDVIDMVEKHENVTISEEY